MWWGNKQIRLVILALVALMIGPTVWVMFENAKENRERSALEGKAPAGWLQARAGMTRQEVISLLGEPPVVHSFFATSPPAASAAAAMPPFPRERWHYAFGETGPRLYQGRYLIDFTNGTVERTSIK